MSEKEGEGKGGREMEGKAWDGREERGWEHASVGIFESRCL